MLALVVRELLLVAVPLLASPCQDAAATPDEAACPPELLGAWRLNEPEAAPLPDLMVRFEPGRCTLFGGGKILFMERILGHADDVLRTASYLEPRRTEVWRDGQSLGLIHQEEVYTLVRAEPVPEELIVKPWPFGDGEVDEARRAALVEEFRVRRARDQEVRIGNDLDWEEIRRVDEDNTAFLKELVREIGWIDAARFGREVAQASFLIVQHSMDRPLMLAALPRIKAEVDAGRVDGGQYALLYDRLTLEMGGYQRYGSQVMMDAQNRPVVRFLEDPDGVDERRAALGMISLKEYVALFSAKEAVIQKD